MSKKDDALKLALEAMNLARSAHGQILLSDPPQEAWKAWRVSDALTKAMKAASEALAEQPAYRAVKTFHEGKPVYVAEQPAQQEQKEPIACKSLCELCVKRGYSVCANAAQTTPIPSPQPAQEQEQKPVAWMWKDGTITSDPDRADGTWMPLYTTPPASKPCKVWDAEGYDALCQQLEGWKAKASKPWVGLTDEEVLQLLCLHIDEDDDPDDWAAEIADVRVIEAKLREKNAQPSKPLTDEELQAIADKCRLYPRDFARAIEAAHGIKGEA